MTPAAHAAHSAAEVNELRVRAEKAEAARDAYKQQVAELKEALNIAAEGFASVGNDAAERLNGLRSLLAEVLGSFSEDMTPGAPCMIADVSRDRYEHWVGLAREADVVIPGAGTTGEGPQDGDDDGN